MKIRCIAVDDEPLALEKIATYVAKVSFLYLLDKFSQPLAALDYIKQHQVDLIFLDIQMDELTGLQMLEVLKHKPKIILTTAYAEYALKGYELEVSDYLLKPITFERFMKAVCKVQQELILHKNVVPSKQQETENKNFIFVKNGTKIDKIFINDILFIEGMREYLGINTATQRIMTLMSFKKMEELLPKGQFIRVHKSYIVAIDKIDTIENQQIRIQNHYIPIGDLYKKDFFNKIKPGEN